MLGKQLAKSNLDCKMLVSEETAFFPCLRFRPSLSFNFHLIYIQQLRLICDKEKATEAAMVAQDEK